MPTLRNRVVIFFSQDPNFFQTVDTRGLSYWSLRTIIPTFSLLANKEYNKSIPGWIMDCLLILLFTQLVFQTFVINSTLTLDMIRGSV